MIDMITSLFKSYISILMPFSLVIILVGIASTVLLGLIPASIAQKGRSFAG